MDCYQKYKDAQGRKTGPWFIKYPIGRDPLTGKIKYKIENEVLGILNEVGRVRGLGHNRVFTYKGRPLASIKTCFWRACKAAGITNLRFHDLRHTFNTEMRQAGVDHSVIMKMTGHKTAAMFHRYNTVDIKDLHEACRKREEYLRQQPHHATTGKSAAQEVLP